MATDVLCILDRFKRAERDNEARMEHIREARARLAGIEQEVKDAGERVARWRREAEAHRAEQDERRARAEVEDIREAALQETLAETEARAGEAQREVERSRARDREDAAARAKEIMELSSSLAPGGTASALRQVSRSQAEEEGRASRALAEAEGSLRRLADAREELDKCGRVLSALRESNAALEARARERRRESEALRRREQELQEDRAARQVAHARDVQELQDRIRMLRSIRSANTSTSTSNTSGGGSSEKRFSGGFRFSRN